MSFLTYSLLTEDVNFGRRMRGCIQDQAAYFVNDGRADMAALSRALLKQDNPSAMVALLNQICNAPGFAANVDNGDGTIDQTKITDGDILSACQSAYPQIAALYYNSDGTSRP